MGSCGVAGTVLDVDWLKKIFFAGDENGVEKF